VLFDTRTAIGINLGGNIGGTKKGWHGRDRSVLADLIVLNSYLLITRKPPVEAALVVTYLQFPIQVCFPCNASPSPTLLPSRILVVLIIV